jgi:alpha-tubulin suppressor-like RCC1 family protein
MLVAPEQSVVLDSDPDSARATARAFLRRYLQLSNYTNTMKRGGFTEDDIAGDGSDALIDSIVVHGDEAAIVAALRAHRAAGANHVCAVIQLPAENYSRSNIYCLGNNRSGQLGDGNDNSWPYAREVNRDVNDNRVLATQIALGLNLSCALMEDKNVKCWGSNAHGQIGNSDLQNDNSFRPFDVRLQVAPE